MASHKLLLLAVNLIVSILLYCIESTNYVVVLIGSFENYEGHDNNPPLSVKVAHLHRWMHIPLPNWSHLDQAADICARLLHFQCIDTDFAWSGKSGTKLRNQLLEMDEGKVLAGIGDELDWTYSLVAENWVEELVRLNP